LINLEKLTTLEVFLDGKHEAYMQGAMGRTSKEFRYEIGGVGRVIVDKEGFIDLGPPVILEQEVSTGECEFKDSIVKWLETWAPESLTQEMPNVSFYLWHSHNSMATFWSATDEEWISNYIGTGLLVSLVGNHKAEWKCRVDTVAKVSDKYFHYKLPCKFKIEHEPRPEYIAAAKQAVVDRKRVVTLPKIGKSIHGYNRAWERGVHPQLALAPRSMMSGARYDMGNFDGDDKRDGVVKHADGVSYLPIGTTVAALAKTYGAQLRVYFCQAYTAQSRLHITLMCSEVLSYTVDATPDICSQIRNTFKMPKGVMKAYLGSGGCVQHIRNKGKGPRWRRMELNG